MTKNFQLTDPFFTDEEEQTKLGLLWLPPIEKNRITQKIDWLSNLSITKAYDESTKDWNETLKEIVKRENLALDQKPEYDSKKLLIKLPQEFKSQMALILKDSNWDEFETLYKDYSEASKNLNADFIQCPNFWNDETSKKPQEVEWIRV